MAPKEHLEPRKQYLFRRVVRTCHHSLYVVIGHDAYRQISICAAFRSNPLIEARKSVTCNVDVQVKTCVMVQNALVSTCV